MNWFTSNQSKMTFMSFENNLSRMKNACIEAGNIHKQIRGIIHVAGTNGKGSTIAFLKSILQESGFKVNTATSPHLIKFNERINLNGVDITDNQINDIFIEYKKIIDKYNLSYFERSIFISFIAFLQNKADFNIIEVGLGGILDATNVIEGHKICVITSIGMDHCSILGNTIDEIAANKFGIVNAGDDVVIGYQAKDFGVAGFVGGRDWIVDKTLKLGLEGDHQYYNAGNAIAVCKILNIDDKFVRAGLLNARWPARLQKIGNILIDGAHNIDGIDALCQYLNTVYGKKIGIMAIMKDKDITAIVNKIKGVFDVIYCVNIDSITDRAVSPQILCDILQKNGINAIDGGFIDDLLKNDKIIQEQNVVIFGSLFLAGEVLSNLSNYK